jgi:hypothetical protein
MSHWGAAVDADFEGNLNLKNESGLNVISLMHLRNGDPQEAEVICRDW